MATKPSSACSETIIEAYEEFSPFNSDEIALIEPLRAMRFVYYLAWLIRRWDDPHFLVISVAYRRRLLAQPDIYIHSAG